MRVGAPRCGGSASHPALQISALKASALKAEFGGELGDGTLVQAKAFEGVRSYVVTGACFRTALFSEGGSLKSKSQIADIGPTCLEGGRLL